MLALLYLFIWTLVWVWTATERGNWNLIQANLAGAAGGFVVAMTVSVIGSRLFPADAASSTPFEAASILAVTTTAGVLAGVWMWMARRPRPEHPLVRHMVAGLCALAAGVTTLTIIAVNFR